MKEELIQKPNNELKIKNDEMKTCINYRDSKIDLTEYNISCENSSILLWRV